MKKYYIASGDLRYLQSGVTMLEACAKALKYAQDNNIKTSCTFYISEQGWRNKLTCQWFYKINSVRAYLSTLNCESVTDNLHDVCPECNKNKCSISGEPLNDSLLEDHKLPDWFSDEE